MYTTEEHKIIAKLKAHGIHITRSRINMYRLFSKCKKALSIAHINKHFIEDMDRASIYRILKLFQEKGFLLRIPDTTAGVAYIFNENADAENAQKQIAYFICSCCKKMTMVNESIFKSFSLPEKASIRKCHLIIEGECMNCRH